MLKGLILALSSLLGFFRIVCNNFPFVCNGAVFRQLQKYTVSFKQFNYKQKKT